MSLIAPLEFAFSGFGAVLELAAPATPPVAGALGCAGVPALV
jgi:hypothetical protein